MIVSAIKMSVIDAIRPWIYEKLKLRDFDSIKRNTRLVLIAIIMLIFLLVAFAPELLVIFAPRKYGDAIRLVPVLAGSTYFTFVYNLCSIVEIYYEKNVKIMIASIIVTVTNIILNALLIPVWGFVGAGYTTLVL